MHAKLYAATDKTDHRPNNEISETELEAFAGGKHYPAVLLRMLDGKRQHGGFNVWALLLGVQWFFYRKLYLFGLFAAALELVSPMLAMWVIAEQGAFHPNDRWAVAVIACFIATRVFVAFAANIALCLKAVSVIQEVDGLNKDNETHLRLIRHAGGVSVPAWLGTLVVIGMLRHLWG